MSKKVRKRKNKIFRFSLSDITDSFYRNGQAQLDNLTKIISN